MQLEFLSAAMSLLCGIVGLRLSTVSVVSCLSRSASVLRYTASTRVFEKRVARIHQGLCIEMSTT